MNNYVAYHVHTDLSLLDSVTDYKDYVDYAVSLGQKAIAFSEHGKPLNWVSKKMYCDKLGIKYIHAVEIYVTEQLEPKVRDNMHCVLIAKNYEGVLELNKIVSISCDEHHFYYKNRISIDELCALSKNIIITSACLASPLNKLDISNPRYKDLVNRIDYLEIQPHDCQDQKDFNVHLAQLAQEYGKPLIAGTDAHSLNEYKAECRKIILTRKHLSYGDEDDFDLTYKSYDELVAAFRQQDALPENIWLEAIENTNVMADSVEEFDLDTSFKYPILYGSAEEDARKYREVVWDKFNDKLERGVIPPEQKEGFEKALTEELDVFEQISMSGFMLSMSELVSWCHENGIPTGFARGSVAGSRAAYVTDIIDLNPEKWDTVFSRFANADRVETGDIDTDVIETDRPKIFEHVIEKFGEAKTARVASYGTNKDLGTIDDIGGALRIRWNREHGLKDDEKDDSNPYNLNKIDKIKKSYTTDPINTRNLHPDIFYYFDGIVGTKVSQSVHPAGVVISPITLADHYGVFDKDGMSCLVLDMEDAHAVGLVKYDFLILSNIKIIKDTCDYIGIPYPKSHEINWDDQSVWRDMLKSQIGIFQMESPYASQLLKKFKPKSIEEMSLLTASIRPSGASYRDDLIARKSNKNPSEMIDKLLEKNYGYLVYQEDQIKFLQDICGLSGSEADTIRRAIGKKNKEVIDKAIPRILDGYCNKSDKPRDFAEKEAQNFLQVLEDAASYSFGYNHSIAYCMIGYLCAYFRHYHPYEFITSFLNNAANQEDVENGAELAKVYGIAVTPPKFGVSREDYVYDKNRKIIAKGLSSIKYFNKKVGRELYELGQNKFERFTDVLFALKNTSIDTRQLDILIKIDFFSEFGNIPEITRIVNMFRQLKEGEVKKIKRDGLDEQTESIMKPFATCVNAKGEELKTYTVTDPTGLIRAFEDQIMSLGLKDVSLKIKIANQIETLGATNIATHDPEDRRKLYIEDVVPVISNGKLWCYRIDTMSVGTGKKSRLTLRSHLYNLQPVLKGQIIYCDECYKNNRGYWEITQYHQIY